MQCGVVLFDDASVKRGKTRSREPSDGWASIEGKPARRIKSVNELESNVKWLTNLEFVDFYSNGLNKNPNLFYSGCLRTELRAIADDIGAGVENVSPDKSAQALATVFARVMRLAVECLQVNFNAASVKSLPEFISARSTSKHKLPDEINTALKHAYQPSTHCVTKPQRGWKAALLRRPRYQHAVEVLSTPVPSEFRWAYVNNDRMPLSGQKRIDWCLAQELPVLCNVKVTPRRNDLTPLISYNSGAPVERAWLSQPELLWMSMFCDVEIVGAYICDAGYVHQAELDSFPTLGDFSHAAYSLGLLCENLWVSLASPRVSSTSSQQKLYPPRAIWYRAVDRIEMFKSAVAIHRAGFQVVGYGAGSIWLNYPPGAAKDLVELSADIGLDVPVSKFFEQRNETRLVRDE